MPSKPGRQGTMGKQQESFHCSRGPLGCITQQGRQRESSTTHRKSGGHHPLGNQLPASASRANMFNPGCICLVTNIQTMSWSQLSGDLDSLWVHSVLKSPKSCYYAATRPHWKSLSQRYRANLFSWATSGALPSQGGMGWQLWMPLHG